MANFKLMVIDDVSGGLNDLVNPASLKANEVTEIVNLLPGHNGSMAHIRPGISGIGSALSYPVSGLYRYAIPSGAVKWLMASNKVIYQASSPLGPWTSILTLTSAADPFFAEFQGYAYITNGIDKLYRWDGVAASAVEVVSAEPGVISVPKGKYLLNFKGRLWVTGGTGSTVYASGISDDRIDPGTGLPYKADQNWGGTAQTDGDSLEINPQDGELVTAIGPMYNGLVVFKERSTYLWTYDDLNQPGNTATSRVDPLMPGVGCVGQDTVCYFNQTLYFLGQTKDGTYGVYSLKGTGVEDASVKVPLRLKRILQGSAKRPRAIIHNNCYLIAADDSTATGDERTFVFAYDIRRDCWVEFTGMSVGDWDVDPDTGTLFIGPDKAGKVAQYPLGSTDSGSPIPYTLTPGEIKGKDSISRTRFRKAFVDLTGADNGVLDFRADLGGGDQQTGRRVMGASGVDNWDDGVGSWDDGTLWALIGDVRRVGVSLTGTGSTMAFTVSGETSNPDFAIERIAFETRSRKPR